MFLCTGLFFDNVDQIKVKPTTGGVNNCGKPRTWQPQPGGATTYISQKSPKLMSALNSFPLSVLQQQLGAAAESEELTCCTLPWHVCCFLQWSLWRPLMVSACWLDP